MNKDQIEGQWKIMSGAIKRRWSEVAHDWDGVIKGSATEIVGHLQKEFGLARNDAEAAWERWRSEVLPEARIAAQWARFEEVMAERWSAAKFSAHQAQETWALRIAAVEAEADEVADRVRARYEVTEAEAKQRVAGWLADVRHWNETRPP